ncbi:hypothetical protein ASG82_15520 [Mycobacterium sp. Soil538]|nr:hypothetical protein ASG82_15520 [Mycobacterium sp. Soil538]
MPISALASATTFHGRSGGSAHGSYSPVTTAVGYGVTGMRRTVYRSSGMRAPSRNHFATPASGEAMSTNLTSLGGRGSAPAASSAERRAATMLPIDSPITMTGPSAARTAAPARSTPCASARSVANGFCE